METVQLNLGDAHYAAQLRELLASTGSREVCCVSSPDLSAGGVLVLDPAALNRLPVPLKDPERVVLITSNDPQHLAQAWNAGIRSVVFSEDPLSTAVLAIMAAELRVSKPESHCALSDPCSACEVRTGCGEGPPIGTPIEPASAARGSRLKYRRG